MHTHIHIKKQQNTYILAYIQNNQELHFSRQRFWWYDPILHNAHDKFEWNEQYITPSTNVYRLISYTQQWRNLSILTLTILSILSNHSIVKTQSDKYQVISLHHTISYSRQIVASVVLALIWFCQLTSLYLSHHYHIQCGFSTFIFLSLN